MAPTNDPRRGTPAPGAQPPRPSAQLPIAVDEVPEGAFHPLRPIAQSTDTATTVRPPPPDRRPPPRSSMVGVKVPSLAQPPPLPATESAEQTLVGPLPALEPQDDDGDRKSTHEAIQSADSLAVELAARNAELAKARAELKAAKRPDPVAVAEVDFDAAAYFRKWRDEALKLFIPIVAIAFAASLAVALLLKFTTDLKLDNTKAIQDTQQKTTQTVEERLKALEKYSNALARHSDCIDAQRDSAIERGTGHIVDGDHDVDWAQQNKPALKLRVLWDSAPWSPVAPCPARPKPPPAPT